jgi:hypothetical protein
MLPVLETFDSGTGWTASGAWQFVPAAHSGGGWFADSTARGQTSTLTAGYLLDLRLAQNPELTVWQRALLTTGDGVALEVSVDGGLSWQTLDQQAGATVEWSPRTLSLAAYRGSVVALRFRLDTLGVVPEGLSSTGWWIDELAVVDVPLVPPPPEPSLPPADPPTATPLPTVVPASTPEPTSVPTDVPADVPTEVPPATPEPPVEPTPEPPGE